jgi:hypothetical protein
LSSNNAVSLKPVRELKLEDCRLCLGAEIAIDPQPRAWPQPVVEQHLKLTDGIALGA